VPAGYTRVGTYRQTLSANDRRDREDGPVMIIDIYRKN
jgi:hypothetical protein